MKALSSLVILFALLYSANAFNKWCCYDYAHSLAGWLRLYTAPVDAALASRVCAAEGATLAVTSEDTIQDKKDELVKIAHNANLTIYAGTVAVPFGTKVFDQHRALKPDGSYLEINADEKYPFVCFREVKNFQTNTCGLNAWGYELNNKTKSCYKFHYEMVHWNEANDTCNELGAHLAVINSDDEAQVIKELFAKYPADKIPVPPGLSVGQYLKDYAFLGVTKVGNEWMTNDGQTIAKAGYAKFAPGEPNNARGDENCLAVSREGLMVDEPCDRSKPFFCKRREGESLCHDMNEKAMCNSMPLPMA